MKKKRKTHKLKSWIEKFLEVFNESKRFELRKNDRNYCIGDFVILSEFDRESAAFTGRWMKFEITHITRPSEIGGLDKDFVILGIREISHYRYHTKKWQKKQMASLKPARF